MMNELMKSMTNALHARLGYALVRMGLYDAAAEELKSAAPLLQQRMWKRVLQRENSLRRIFLS
jgi:hypothetical protein